ncbi:MAG: Asp23/Gls24 family envelope stress response protein [Dehalococcoidia bacterium]|nr:Asp23/Gls24 family envelope stress response protein [Dehalococcoidia bacterium]
MPKSMPQGKRLGKVEVSAEAVATIAGRAVIQSYGVVGMASRRFKDGIATLLHHDSCSKGVDVHLNSDQVIIDLFVVVEYGTRISEVAKNIMCNVKFAVEQSLGTPVAQVNVNVQGLRISGKD